jgi:hypothetical protein
MQTLNWLESHVGSLEEGIELANKFHWFITVVEGTSGEKWFVKSGEIVIFSTHSKDALDAFLYGIGLAYSVIPDDLFDDLCQKTDEDFEGSKSMTWEEIREQYPNRWVVLQALGASIEHGKLVVPTMKFVGEFDQQAGDALDYATQMQRTYPQREYFFCIHQGR